VNNHQGGGHHPPPFLALEEEQEWKTKLYLTSCLGNKSTKKRVVMVCM
jgi:hypothetical protein